MQNVLGSGRFRKVDLKGSSTPSDESRSAIDVRTLILAKTGDEEDPTKSRNRIGMRLVGSQFSSTYVSTVARLSFGGDCRRADRVFQAPQYRLAHYDRGFCRSVRPLPADRHSVDSLAFKSHTTGKTYILVAAALFSAIRIREDSLFPAAN